MELNPEEFFVAELFHTNTKQEKQSNDVLNCLGLGFCVQSNDILNCCTQTDQGKWCVQGEDGESPIASMQRSDLKPLRAKVLNRWPPQGEALQDHIDDDDQNTIPATLARQKADSYNGESYIRRLPPSPRTGRTGHTWSCEKSAFATDSSEEESKRELMEMLRRDAARERKFIETDRGRDEEPLPNPSLQSSVKARDVVRVQRSPVLEERDVMRAIC